MSSTEEEKCVSLSLRNIPVHGVKCRVLSCGGGADSGRTESHCASIQVLYLSSRLFNSSVQFSKKSYFVLSSNGSIRNSKTE